MFAMVLDFFDYIVIACIFSAFGASAAAVYSTQDKARLARLEAKMDLLLEHAGLELAANTELPDDVRKALEDERN